MEPYVQKLSTLLQQPKTHTIVNHTKTLNAYSKFQHPNLRMSWSCKKCTFLNPPSQKPTCQICESPSSPTQHPNSSSSPSPSSSIPKWACKACTFLNPYTKTNCEICGTRSSILTLSSFDELRDIGDGGDELGSSVGSVFFPLQRCSKRKSSQSESVEVDQGCVELERFRGDKARNKGISVKEDENSCQPSSSAKVLEQMTSVKILSYNVWFREDLEMHRRMKAVGELVQLYSPDIICFQEVTPNIYNIFQQSSWWKHYRCSLSSEMANSRPYFCMLLSKLSVGSFYCKPFKNSIMGRELCIAEVEVPGMKPLVVATSHLESPCPAPPKWDQMFSKERVDQAKEVIDFLKKSSNVIWGGDMNWDDKLDGHFPLPEGWVDAWEKLKPGEKGWTYDTKSNPMLSANRTLQKRLDRFVCNLCDFNITGIDMIGMDAIPSLTYSKEKKVRKELTTLELPVLPSDHFGLLLTIISK